VVRVGVGDDDGAGKSTAGPPLLRDALGLTEFVNADVIAQGLSAFDPEGAAFEAGRVMLQRIRDLGRRRVSFAFETALAGRSYVRWISKLKEQGYVFEIFFFWVPSPEAAISRVAARVEAGGHDVPEEVVRRRYHLGLRNFFRLYRGMAVTWQIYDTTRGMTPQMIAWGSGDRTLQVLDRRTWEQIEGDHRGDP
jgi:predicted ABC-type ATPase